MKPVININIVVNDIHIPLWISYAAYAIKAALDQMLFRESKNDQHVDIDGLRLCS
jgi:hypothetical protein